MAGQASFSYFMHIWTKTNTIQDAKAPFRKLGPDGPEKVLVLIILSKMIKLLFWEKQVQHH